MEKKGDEGEEEDEAADEAVDGEDEDAAAILRLSGDSSSMGVEALPPADADDNVDDAEGTAGGDTADADVGAAMPEAIMACLNCSARCEAGICVEKDEDADRDPLTDETVEEAVDEDEACDEVVCRFESRAAISAE
jgi:hypothetical protein